MASSCTKNLIVLACIAVFISNNAQVNSTDVQSGLKIVFASYGPQEVTEIVRSQVENGKTSIAAENSIFTDPWPYVVKSLIVLYQYGDSEIFHKIVKEHETLKMDVSLSVPLLKDANPGLKIVFASYGPQEVTQIVRSQVKNDQLSIAAENAIFTDTWPGMLKSLVVVYQYGDSEIAHAIVKEHETLKIEGIKHSEHTQGTVSDENLFKLLRDDEIGLKIVFASYGPLDVTEIVRSRVNNGETSIAAENSIFTDPWPYVVKSLIVLYQYEDSEIFYAIVKEHETLKIDENHPVLSEDATSGLKIVFASYGPKEVTQIVRSQVENDELSIAAENAIFTDTWPGTMKTLVVLYQKRGSSEISHAIVKEHEALNIEGVDILTALYDAIISVF